MSKHSLVFGTLMCMAIVSPTVEAWNFVGVEPPTEENAVTYAISAGGEGATVDVSTFRADGVGIESKTVTIGPHQTRAVLNIPMREEIVRVEMSGTGENCVRVVHIKGPNGKGLITKIVPIE